LIPVRSLWLDFSLAFRNVVRQKRRSAIAVGAVAFGITALLLASGFIEWIFMDFRESTIQSQLGHLQIVKPGYHDAGKADPYSFLLPEAIPELEAPNEPRRIKTVAPRLSFSGLVSLGEATLSFIGDGVSPEEEAKFGKGLQVSSGTNLSADEPLGIIMGEGLARNLGAKVGDKVVLLANTATGGTNAVEVSVRGLFSTVTKAYDDAALRVPIGTARTLLRAKGSHLWVVLLNETSDTDSTLANLRNKLPQDQFEVVPWHKLADLYNKTAALFTKQIQGIRLIIALIILLSISNTMTMSVMERISEIGTCMALGVKRIGILRLFLSEGILLGCFGGMLGLLAGTGLAAMVSAIGIPMPPPPGMTHGYTGAILVTPRIALEAFILAVGTTLAASVYPAWTASRKVIVDALRHSR
jgi:putative ABC transport system permease protein